MYFISVSCHFSVAEKVEDLVKAGGLVQAYDLLGRISPLMTSRRVPMRKKRQLTQLEQQYFSIRVHGKAPLGATRA